VVQLRDHVVKFSRLVADAGQRELGLGLCEPYTKLRTELLKRLSLEYRTMDKIQKPSNSECYTPLTEPFRI
jgi:hypothetical protein